jgi:glutamate synthase (NADPH/NADH) large chain
MFVLLNNYTVLSFAQQLALGKLPKGHDVAAC